MADRAAEREAMAEAVRTGKRPPPSTRRTGDDSKPPPEWGEDEKIESARRAREAHLHLIQVAENAPILARACARARRCHATAARVPK